MVWMPSYLSKFSIASRIQKQSLTCLARAIHIREHYRSTQPHTQKVHEPPRVSFVSVALHQAQCLIGSTNVCQRVQIHTQIKERMLTVRRPPVWSCSWGGSAYLETCLYTLTMSQKANADECGWRTSSGERQKGEPVTGSRRERSAGRGMVEKSQSTGCSLGLPSPKNRCRGEVAADRTKKREALHMGNRFLIGQHETLLCEETSRKGSSCSREFAICPQAYWI